jgi:hypothetical protein
MKFVNFYRKSISLIVLAAFVALLHFWAMPAPAATARGNSAATVTSGANNGPGFLEQESKPGNIVKKEKKFPWLIVGLATVAVAITVFILLSKKPKYTLNVSLAAGVSGTPAVTGTYKKGTIVTYNYTASAGYNMHVKLDHADVPASGKVTMDKDKTLAVTTEFLDIRGTWQLAMLYLTPNYSIYNYSSTWVFSGSLASGTFTEVAGPITNHGTYSVTNTENVWFKYNDASDTFIGKMTGTSMSGTFAAGSVYNGTWSGTKTSSSTSGLVPDAPAALPAAGQEPKRR